MKETFLGLTPVMIKHCFGQSSFSFRVPLVNFLTQNKGLEPSVQRMGSNPLRTNDGVVTMGQLHMFVSVMYSELLFVRNLFWDSFNLHRGSLWVMQDRGGRWLKSISCADMNYIQNL